MAKRQRNTFSSSLEKRFDWNGMEWIFFSGFVSLNDDGGGGGEREPEHDMKRQICEQILGESLFD